MACEVCIQNEVDGCFGIRPRVGVEKAPRTVSLSQLIHLGIIMLAIVIAVATVAHQLVLIIMLAKFSRPAK